MSNHTTLQHMFAVLHRSLPYEYDVHANDKDTDHSIVINKKDSEHTIYITANAPDDNGIVDTTLYDSIYDDPVEITQWDTNDPNFSLIDIIAYIEKTL